MDAALAYYARRYKRRGVSADAAIPRLAWRFERTPASIYARLLKLDLITP